MTAQRIFEKTEELVQAIKDQPEEALVYMWVHCECHNYEAREALCSIIRDELKKRHPDDYGEWYKNMFVNEMRLFVDELTTGCGIKE